MNNGNQHKSAFSDIDKQVMIVAALVHKAGGKIELRQSNMDAIRGMILHEDQEGGVLTLELKSAPARCEYNPNNPKQRRVFFDSHAAFEKAQDTRHPQIIMAELAEAQNFSILDAVPQSLFDGWDFWIEEHGIPAYSKCWRAGLAWKPVGAV